MPRVRKRHQLALLCLAAAALWLSGLFWFVRATGEMTPGENLPPLDAVVVLTGGTNRIETGFRLLNDGMGHRLFISGVYRGVEARELMDLSRQESAEKLSCCVALGNADNTIENAQETAAWLAREGFSSFYLVTSNYHMKRALLEFGAAAPELSPVPWPVAPGRLDMTAWWRDPVFRVLIVREYTKYLLAHFRHFIIQ